MFGAFLKLGFTSFGGPVAHLGYFRAEFVERREWLNDAKFSRLLALSQFLPGPASSQLGFAIGLQRAGWVGGVAAFAAFTLPSALLLFALALTASALNGPWWTGTIHGLKLVAVVVVADALWKMGRQLTPDVTRLAIAAMSAAAVLWMGGAGTQLLALGIGAVAGLLTQRSRPSSRVVQGPQDTGAVDGSGAPNIAALAAFTLILLAALSVRQDGASLVGLSAGFIRAGSLVFGGGHVVLPLLEESMVATGLVSTDAFLTGYGAAQAVPGPMFSFAAYLGALAPWAAQTPSVLTSAVGAAVALLAVFTPGFLLIFGILPIWTRISANHQAVGVIAGVNAAVVGLLGAALYSPVITTGIAALSDVVIVLIGFALHRGLNRPTLWLALWCIAAALTAQAL